MERAKENSDYLYLGKFLITLDCVISFRFCNYFNNYFNNYVRSFQASVLVSSLPFSLGAGDLILGTLRLMILISSKLVSTFVMPSTPLAGKI